jgi:hypothetical protein
LQQTEKEASQSRPATAEYTLKVPHWRRRLLLHADIGREKIGKVEEGRSRKGRKEKDGGRNVP